MSNPNVEQYLCWHTEHFLCSQWIKHIVQVEKKSHHKTEKSIIHEYKWLLFLVFQCLILQSLFLKRGFFPLELLVFKRYNSYTLKDIRLYTVRRCKARNKTECTAGLYNRRMKPSTTCMCSQRPHALDDLCMDRLHGSPRKSPYKFQCKINMPCTWSRAGTKLFSGALLSQVHAVGMCMCERQKRLSRVKQTMCCLYSGSLLWSQNAAPVFSS